jgi:hypothetical protein
VVLVLGEMTTVDGVTGGGEAMDVAPPEVRANPAAVPPALTTAMTATTITTPTFGPRTSVRNRVSIAVPFRLPCSVDRENEQLIIAM